MEVNYFHVAYEDRGNFSSFQCFADNLTEEALGHVRASLRIPETAVFLSVNLLGRMTREHFDTQVTPAAEKAVLFNVCFLAGGRFYSQFVKLGKCVTRQDMVDLTSALGFFNATLISITPVGKV